MSDTENDKIPKDQEEAEKFYGDEHNNQRKKEDSDKVKNKDVNKDKLDKDKRSNSNVLSHPRDKDDESFEVDHNKKKSDKK